MTVKDEIEKAYAEEEEEANRVFKTVEHEEFEDIDKTEIDEEGNAFLVVADKLEEWKAKWKKYKADKENKELPA